MQLKLLKKDKVLIIGCGYEQLNAINLAKKKGLHVIGVDKNFKAPGVKFCNEFFPIDIKNKNLLLKLAKVKKIKGVLTVASDLAVPTVNFIQRKLNLTQNKKFDVKFTTNKFFMKKNFIENKIPTSNFIKISSKKKLNNFLLKKSFPFVLKPIFSYGQKGIFFINTKKQLLKKIKLAKQNCYYKSALIEEYQNGYEINIVLMVENYIIKSFLFSKRITEPAKSFGIADQHVYPANVPLHLKKKILKDLKKLILSLNFRCGILYPQIIISGNNYYFLEMASRVPGGFMRELMILACGVDPIEFEILNSLNIKKIFKHLKNTKKYRFIKVLFLTKKNYKHKKIKEIDKQQLLKKNPSLYDIFLNYEVDRNIPDLKNSTHRIGAIITRSSSKSMVNKSSVKILNILNK